MNYPRSDTPDQEEELILEDLSFEVEDISHDEEEVELEEIEVLEDVEDESDELLLDLSLDSCAESDEEEQG